MSVVCLCGPVKFEPYFRLAKCREELRGNRVLMPLLGLKPIPEGAREAVRHVHRLKIEMADEVFVVNVGGYIGDHTKEEIEYAKSLGKAVRWYDEEVGSGSIAEADAGLAEFRRSTGKDLSNG